MVSCFCYRNIIGTKLLLLFEIIISSQNKKLRTFALHYTLIYMITEAIIRYLERHNYKSIRCKAALIDMDGVLYDSMPNHTEAWYRTMSAIGIPCSREEFYLFEGRTRASTINILFNRAYGHDAPEEVSRSLYEEKVRQFQLLPEVLPMPGASDMLRVLKENDIRPVLVTGSSQGGLLDRLGEDYPGAFVEPYRITGEDVKLGKPHPEPYLMGLSRIGAHPNEAIVIENAPLGVEAGASAGIFTVAVNTGPVPQEALYGAGADIVFCSMTDFASQISSFISALNTVMLP